MKLIKLCTGMMLTFLSSWLQAQPVEMADTLRSEGKIYVVVAIILVIFTGISIYLFRLDRKVTRLEKKFPEIQR